MSSGGSFSLLLLLLFCLAAWLMVARQAGNHVGAQVYKLPSILVPYIPKAFVSSSTRIVPPFALYLPLNTGKS